MSQRPAGSARQRTAWWLTASIAGVVLAAAVAWQAWPLGPPSGLAGSGGRAVARRETRPTLEPAEFLGKAALAYQVAREIPDVLDQIHCYCECDRYYGHQTLLSCYTDRHAAT